MTELPVERSARPEEVFELLLSDLAMAQHQATRDMNNLPSSEPADPSCRICFGNGHEVLLSPCDCNGTQAFVHFSCIKEWIETSNNKNCNVCSVPYNGIRIRCRRGSIIESFMSNDWIFQALFEPLLTVWSLLLLTLLIQLTICDMVKDSVIQMAFEDVFAPSRMEVACYECGCFLNTLLILFSLTGSGATVFLGLWMFFWTLLSGGKKLQVTGFDQAIVNR